MIGNSDINDLEKDKIWYGLIDILVSEEIDEDGESIVDLEEIAYAGSYLSMNFSALNERIRNTLMDRVVCQELCKISSGLVSVAGTEMFLKWRLRTTA